MINSTLIEYLWRERLTSVPRMLLVLSAIGMNRLYSAMMGGVPPAAANSALVLFFILGPGIIGRDVSSGSLHLILVRPVRRSEYILSRWVGLALLVSMFALVQLALTVVPRPEALWTMPVFCSYYAEQVALIFGASAVLVFLSTLVGGYGDIVLLVAGLFAGGMAAMIGMGAQIPWLVTFGTELGQLLVPHIELMAIYAGNYQDPRHYLIYWFISVVVSLALAIVLIRRRDFSYASAG
jgi:hypothetical protein